MVTGHEAAAAAAAGACCWGGECGDAGWGCSGGAGVGASGMAGLLSVARAGWPGSARCDASPARYLARGGNGAAVVLMGCGGAYGLRWWRVRWCVVRRLF